MRCFIGIEIPKNIRAEINSLLIQLKKLNSGNKIKWVESHNMHLTVQFIGDIDLNRAEEFKKALKNIKLKPFEIGFDNKLSFFPNKFNPNIAKISVLDKKENLKKLNLKIREQLNKLGINYDRKPFSAHLTLGRIKYLNSQFNHSIIFVLPNLQILKFVLFCSELGSDSPIYTRLAEYTI